MLCCARCLGDAYLRRTVFEIRSSEHGKCNYCGSDSQPLLPPAELRDNFELLLGIYVLDADGRSIEDWLRADWGLFDHPAMDPAHAEQLLGDIMDDGELVRRSFSPRDVVSAAAIEQWDAFRNELMFANRFFPKNLPDLDRLKTLISYLSVDDDELPRRYYRARIQEASHVRGMNEMGAPPAHLSTNGRANPSGIPYLYLASDEKTAISEVRPHVGDRVSVATVDLRGSPKIADLRNPKKTASPFALPDGASVGRHRQELPFLERLGEELSRPVRQRVAHIDYLPSQYLCEFIKHCGFDGVMYRSLVGGVNVALFDPTGAEVSSVASFGVQQVDVEFGA